MTRRLGSAVLATSIAITAMVIASHDRPAAAATGLRVTPVMAGLNNPWDLAFAPDGTMFVTERGGRLLVRLPDGGVRQLSINQGDLWASGETGFMGIEVDPDFALNRRIYTCQGTTDNGNTVQVLAWAVDGGYTTASRVNDPLVGGIDGSSGRHGGCQLRIDASGALLVGTGDAATGTNPQSTSGLAGKVLRVDRFSGAGAPGNPFFNEGGNRARLLTWGHRNVQGLALQPGTGDVYSVEHGPDRDDEVNVLNSGGNYGWDPVPGYNESVPMTDFAKFPGAVPAAYSTGGTTFALSGATFLRGAGWGSREGALAVTALKDARVRLLYLAGRGVVSAQEVPVELDRTFGRLRGAESGPGGLLYLTTDNGGGRDQVLAVAPPGDAFAPGASAAPAPAVDIASRGVDDQVWLRSWSGSAWLPWSSLGGIATSDSDTSTWGGDRLDVVVRGLDNAVWHRAREGGQWSAWTSLGGFATSAPTIASVGPGRLDVFVRGIDGALWAQSYANGHWGGWSTLGGLLASDPDAVAVNPGWESVFVRGIDDRLWFRSLVNGSWGPWADAGGILTSAPSAATTDGNRVDVFVRGIDDALWHTWSLGGTFAPWDLGAGVLTSGPDATWRGGFLDAFMRGVDGGLYQIYWDGSSWVGALKLS